MHRWRSSMCPKPARPPPPLAFSQRNAVDVHDSRVQTVTDAGEALIAASHPTAGEVRSKLDALKADRAALAAALEARAQEV